MLPIAYISVTGLIGKSMAYFYNSRVGHRERDIKGACMAEGNLPLSLSTPLLKTLIENNILLSG